MVKKFSVDDVEAIVGDIASIAHTFKYYSGELLPSEGRHMGLGNYVAIEAAKNGHVSTLEYLALKGVDLSAEVSGNGVAGWTAIGVAVSHGQEAAVDFLRQLPSVDISGEGINPPRAKALRFPDTTLVELAIVNGHTALADKIVTWAKEQRETGPKRESSSGVKQAFVFRS